MQTSETVTGQAALEPWVGDVPEFMSAYWRTRPGVFHPADGLASPLTLDDVDQALRDGSLRVPYIEMAHTDRTIAQDAYCTARTVNHTVHQGFADGGKIREQIAKGATLLLRCVEQWHPATTALTTRLGHQLGRKAEAFFFVTPPGRQGLRVHRDDADVFVLQVNGSKDWQLHTGPADGHWHPGPVAEPGPALLTPTLHPGDVLYIPRGFAHSAVGSHGLSAHLSLTVRDIGGQHLYRELLRRLTDGYRPQPRPLDDTALTDQARDLVGHLSAALARTTPEQLVAAARQSLRAEAVSNPEPGLRAMAASLEATP
ncbi:MULTISPECIES: JmjC domain-containing protein [unclassified Streptomyces]|uniref:JmjC domain-containing protein n=1 Tax=unclassified Streptomyces TaxID=2593676 RepID=UPI0037F8C244